MKQTVPYKYIMEYSTDGEVWETLSDKSENTNKDCPQIDKKDETVTARYIRITFMDGGVDIERDTGNSPVGIFEMNMYGTLGVEENKPFAEFIQRDGRLLYTSEYSADCDFDMFAALYDESGTVVDVKKNEPTGEFDVPKSGNYTAKMFFWNDMTSVQESIQMNMLTNR